MKNMNPKIDPAALHRALPDGVWLDAAAAHKAVKHILRWPWLLHGYMAHLVKKKLVERRQGKPIFWRKLPA